MRINLVESLAHETWARLVTVKATVGEALALVKLLDQLAQLSLNTLLESPASAEPEMLEGAEGEEP